MAWRWRRDGSERAVSQVLASDLFRACLRVCECVRASVRQTMPVNKSCVCVRTCSICYSIIYHIYIICVVVLIRLPVLRVCVCSPLHCFKPFVWDVIRATHMHMHSNALRSTCLSRAQTRRGDLSPACSAAMCAPRLHVHIVLACARTHTNTTQPTKNPTYMLNEMHVSGAGLTEHALTYRRTCQRGGCREASSVICDVQQSVKTAVWL